MPDEPIQVLFIGLSSARIAWYRIVLPAMYLGCDWIGVSRYPPKLHFETGYVKQETKMPRFEEYRVIVIQQPRGRGWLRLIEQLKSRGITVLYEIDDYVHGIRRVADHGFKEEFTSSELHKMVMCMRASDGIICSTPYLAEQYERYNRTWVCPNALDMARYRLSRPVPEPGDGPPPVVIGWAGATGHVAGLSGWIGPIVNIMRRHEHVRFCSIGQDFAAPFNDKFPGRGLSVPFGALETYPSAMTILDVALAPAGDSGFYAGKSALRAMEAGALGIPVVADPRLYASVVLDGQTGFLAGSPVEAELALEKLVTDDSLRLTMGAAARDHVRATCDMRQGVEAWKTAIIQALS